MEAARRRRARRWPAASALVLLGLVLPAPASGLDTTETWDLGPSNLEAYLDLDGPGGGSGLEQLTAAALLGVGIVDRFSFYLSTWVGTGEGLGSAGGALALGVLGTPIDTDHFDLDLALEVSSVGTAEGTDLSVAPAIELNVDLRPDLELWGLYAVASLPITGRPGEPGVTVHLDFLVGTYLTLGRRHQLLAAYLSQAQLHRHRTVDLGTVALGYNVQLSAAFELVTEVHVSLPAPGERARVGGLVGFVATLPTRRR